MKQTYIVRLLGVDAPPSEAWSIVAVETLDEWLTNKIVRIEQDKTVINKQDELPRYLYLDNELINLKLIESGLARSHFEAPDTKLKAKFTAAVQTAQADEVGLWGPDPTATPVPSLAPTLTATMTITATLTPTVTSTGPITITPTVTVTTAP